MKNFIYPLIATSLITITPFLLTFEKGQDIVRGLFCYSVFALLLFFVNVHESSLPLKKIGLACIAIFVFIVSFVDLANLLNEKNMDLGWRWCLPLGTCTIALFLLKPVRKLSLYSINVLLFLSLMVHLLLAHIVPEQPIFEFPVVKAFNNVAIKNTNRDSIPESARTRFNATDSVSITKYYVDTTKNNVVVLVESWGVPIDTNMFNKQLAMFEGFLKKQGIHFRMYSRTRTAEREDLLYSIYCDSTGHRDSLFLPRRFADFAFQTTFLFGGDSTIQWRYKYIRDIGFQNAIYADTGLEDAFVAAKIDSILTGADTVKQFITWTTRDTRFPMNDAADEFDSLYFSRLDRSLQIVAKLARKHPDTRFIVQGDHEPILSPENFRKQFYRRWVPFVVLN